jgi:RNA ligase (TIGR02306 family)
MFEFLPRWERQAQKIDPEIKNVLSTGGEQAVEDVVAENGDGGSIYKVPFTTIVKVEPHNNAERLEVAFVYGFQVIVSKGKYQPGDKVVYVPIDSLLPQWLEDQLFPPDSKIKLHHHRVRQIKIRGLASQGMIVDSTDIKSKVNPIYLDLEQDLATVLGVTKYEPPQQRQSTGNKHGTPRNRPLENARFHKYGGVDNIKWFPTFFEGKEVVIQEKLHGSCCRASFAKTTANTLWKKILRFFGKLPAYEYCYGSNNVQLQERKNYTGFYGTDIYGAVLNKVGAFDRLKPGETIFGELIGPGVQKNYDYGHTEHHFVLFDVKVERPDGTQEYLDPEQAAAFAKERGFDFVPVLYVGVFNPPLAKILSMGASVYNPKQKVREGVVVKARTEYSNNSSKKALKLISEDYLGDTSNTDFH